MAHSPSPLRIAELDGAAFPCLSQVLQRLVTIGLAVSAGASLGLLIKVRGPAFERARSAPRTLALACRTRLPEAGRVALVAHTPASADAAEEFQAYARLIRGGPDVEIFRTEYGARVWLAEGLGLEDFLSAGRFRKIG
jgi:hypothetical protein